jgi:fatty-acyl-CoA synthase
VGTELRIVGSDGAEVPADGSTAGEIQVRGPWITDGYHGRDDADCMATDDAGRRWLRTGDLATIDGERVVRITDRTKDVIKSGGEWISSVELENVLAAHPCVAEAAVIGIPHERWFERPLAVVVRTPGSAVEPAELAAHVAGAGLPGWWTPEQWTFTDELPKTSTFKLDKKVLRARHGAGGFAVETIPTSSVGRPAVST